MELDSSVLDCNLCGSVGNMFPILRRNIALNTAHQGVQEISNYPPVLCCVSVLQIVYLTAGAAVPAVIEETFQSLLNDSFNDAYEKINKVRGSSHNTCHINSTPLHIQQHSSRYMRTIRITHNYTHTPDTYIALGTSYLLLFPTSPLPHK